MFLAWEFHSHAFRCGSPIGHGLPRSPRLRKSFCVRDAEGRRGRKEPKREPQGVDYARPLSYNPIGLGWRREKQTEGRTRRIAQKHGSAGRRQNSLRRLVRPSRIGREGMAQPSSSPPDQSAAWGGSAVLIGPRGKQEAWRAYCVSQLQSTEPRDEQVLWELR